MNRILLREKPRRFWKEIIRGTGKPDEKLNIQTDASDKGMSGARFQRYGGQTIKRTNSIEKQQDEQA
jgi:hypothetical protein